MVLLLIAAVAGLSPGWPEPGRTERLTQRPLEINTGLMSESQHREPGQEEQRRGRWTCRLHVWHRWRTHRYPQSEARYQECFDCGKQRDVPIGVGLV